MMSTTPVDSGKIAACSWFYNDGAAYNIRLIERRIVKHFYELRSKQGAPLNA